MNTMQFLLPLFFTFPAAHPLAAEGVTSLTNPQVKYTVPDTHHVVLKRGPVTAVVVDNGEVDTADIPGHRRRYNGLAVLKHDAQPRNLFVPSYAGVNYEHIHDGKTAEIVKEKFEPREFPMQLRVIDQHTVEVYQAPTHIHKLESCGRYSILPDGTIEYTFECIPHADNYSNGYIGLFWASYINQPEDKAIQFKARKAKTQDEGVGFARSRPSMAFTAHIPRQENYRCLNMTQTFHSLWSSIVRIMFTPSLGISASVTGWHTR